MRLLIAEDDQALGSFLRRGLAADLADMAELEEGPVEIEIAGDGPAAIESFLREEPDLLLLDLDLPGCCGTEVLAVVRGLSPLCPVLVLSGRAETGTRVACLDLGADDCMQKPFSLAELRARCRGLLRRRQAARDHIEERGAPGARSAALIVAGAQEWSVLQMGMLRMQRLERRVDLGGAPLHLTNREFGLLEQLLLACGAPVSRAALREAVWGAKAVETNVVDVHMAALRRKLGGLAGGGALGASGAGSENGRRDGRREVLGKSLGIETIRGAGFRLFAPGALLSVSVAGSSYTRA